MLNIKVAIRPDIDRAMRQFPDIMLRHVARGTHRAAEEVAREEKQVVPKAFSTLVNSIKSSSVSQTAYRVGPGVNYADAVEFGTDPGTFPDIQHIREWLRVKHIAPQNSDFDERDLAYFIARGIFRHGIKPQPFAAPTVKKMAPRVHEIVNASIRTGLREAGAR